MAISDLRWRLPNAQGGGSARGCRFGEFVQHSKHYGGEDAKLKGAWARAMIVDSFVTTGKGGASRGKSDCHVKFAKSRNLSSRLAPD